MLARGESSWTEADEEEWNRLRAEQKTEDADCAVPAKHSRLTLAAVAGIGHRFRGPLTTTAGETTDVAIRWIEGAKIFDD